MKRAIICAPLFLLLACAPKVGQLYVKAGSTTPERQRDIDECRIAAIREISQHTVTEYEPGYSSPGMLSCTTYGSSTTCNTVGAVNIAPSIKTYDENAGLRERMIERCLGDRGYVTVQTRLCSADEPTSYSPAPQSAAGTFQCVRKDQMTASD